MTQISDSLWTQTSTFLCPRLFPLCHSLLNVFLKGEFCWQPILDIKFLGSLKLFESEIALESLTGRKDVITLLIGEKEWMQVCWKRSRGCSSVLVWASGKCGWCQGKIGQQDVKNAELFLSLFFAMIRHIYLLICTQVRFLPSTEIGRQGRYIFQGLHLKKKVSPTLEKDISLIAKLLRGWEKIYIFSTHFKRVEEA